MLRCTDPRCLTGELSLGRFTAREVENFTPLAKARVRPVPCASFPGLFHTKRRVGVTGTHHDGDGSR
ncbi:hypothetical protein Lfu02_16940 [Longispora fulva]|uniref:Uncharacterized protein n=1 Tax=Longispora fulva TaxID=619741 RepID=A0A8J7GGK5_9ACTN|nr:hypothetical protein [Longispora fulva]MBG6140298.1 hypothetical protein [Longispora fulva]GIG57322.1 hypothetical protein Lfu02_16940 [Longispora fulva]